MDSLNGLLSSDSAAISALYSPSDKNKTVVKEIELAQSSPDASTQSLLIGTIGGAQKEDTVSLNFGDLYKGLSISAKSIVDAINQQLGDFAPAGVQNLKPEDVTPEATADRIVTGSVAFFDAYAKQHKDLEGEELIDSFMAEIRKGIKTGYDDAFNILKGLGAFEVEGVQDGIEKTKSLIEEKLVAFENQKRKEFGLPVAEETRDNAAEKTKNEVTAQAGASINFVA